MSEPAADRLPRDAVPHAHAPPATPAAPAQGARRPRIGIVMLGHVRDALRQQFGDYDALYARPITAACPAARCDVIPLIDIADQPDHDVPSDAAAYDGLVLSGGLAMVTDGGPWVDKAAMLVRSALDHEVPLLGVCLGHQLLAHAAGGRVGPHGLGWKLGTETVVCHPDAAGDPIFGRVASPFPASVSHMQAVLAPPPDAAVLGRTSYDPFHMFRIGRCAWGVQFHPEFSDAFMHAALALARPRLEQLVGPTRARAAAASVRPAPLAAQVLTTFARYCADVLA